MSRKQDLENSNKSIYITKTVFQSFFRIARMIISVVPAYGVKVECLLSVRKVMGSSHSRVLPKTLKMVHTTHFKKRVWKEGPGTVVCGVSHEVLHL